MSWGARFVEERPRDPAHWDRVAAIARETALPLLLNGDVFARADIGRARELGAASVMLARGALANPSVFRAAGLLPFEEAMRDFMRTVRCRRLEAARVGGSDGRQAVTTDNPPPNTKYTLQQMLRYANMTKHRFEAPIISAKTARDLWDVLEMGDEYKGVPAPSQPGPVHRVKRVKTASASVSLPSPALAAAAGPAQGDGAGCGPAPDSVA
jgi:tRNA-dihydrouridine synthase 2